MCANVETTSAGKAGIALRRTGVALTIAIVGPSAASVARVMESSAPSTQPPQPEAAPAARPAPDAPAPDTLAAKPAPDTPAPQPAPVMYTVVPGDHLTKIAAEHGLDQVTGWRVVYNANPSVAHPDIIVPGQQLRIPAPGELVPPRPLFATAPSRSAGHTTRAPAPARPGGGLWDRLARCESGGRWSANGFFDGGLQFHPRTWNAYGGRQYAPSANQATREQQIAVAERVRASQGWRAWPTCSAKLGLR